MPEEGDAIADDYGSIGLSLRRHPLALIRLQLGQHGIRTSEELRTRAKDRQKVLATFAGDRFFWLAAAVLTVSAHAASDGPAEKSGQVPGYYRQMLGDVQVTAPFDGVVPLSRSQIVGSPINGPGCGAGGGIAPPGPRHHEPNTYCWLRRKTD